MAMRMRLTATIWLRDRYGRRQSPSLAHARSVVMAVSRLVYLATALCSWQGATWSSMDKATRDQSTRWILLPASIDGNTVHLGLSFLPLPTQMASSLMAQAPPWKSSMHRVAPVYIAIPQEGISTPLQASPMGRSIRGERIIVSMPLA